MEFPIWFPWMIVGGLSFMILSFIASKYNQRRHETKSFAQDFIGGSMLIAMMGVLVPDYFPKFALFSDLPSIDVNSMIKGGGSGDGDFDLQVGPLRR